MKPATLGLVIILVAGISCGTSDPPPPIATIEIRTYDRYEGYSNTAQADLTSQAQDDQIYIWESQETEAAGQTKGCPNGCAYSIPGCIIKGNISAESGEKIYHVPGQEYYNQTSIDANYGERWFCTEQEAISNGWRKSYK